MASIATAQHSPYKNNNNTLKRRSPSPLDCQSLQSSLKRVRLSCSPGELRLQRDVRSLNTMGWEVIASDRWHHCATNAQLTQQDPLRLKLCLANGSNLWIQIPRMYPHRPPVISRLEGHLWMERVVVQESPGLIGRPSSSSSCPIVCGSTVVYNEWSPILHIGHLLEFLIKTGLSGRPVVEQNYNHNDNDNNMAVVKEGMNHHHHQHHHHVSSKSHCDGFMEEHKMDDSIGTMPVHYMHSRVDCDTTTRTSSQFLAPNRFDAGYGKYQDPLCTTVRNAMEL